MNISRRTFLQGATLLASIASGSQRRTDAAPQSPSYPYLGRTADYGDFQIMDPGRKITQVESWTLGGYGIVRITTQDGRTGIGQLSSFEPDITATVLHRPVARHVLGSDPAQIDALVDRVIDANMKFPWSYVCRAQQPSTRPSGICTERPRISPYASCSAARPLPSRCTGRACGVTLRRRTKPRGWFACVTPTGSERLRCAWGHPQGTIAMRPRDGPKR